ncbi:MAG: hypothetical protein HY889_04690 [Deltaproteobacteria bacterium]|nr:hypothetical protein [Deltaproteobacteria bacterium]
MPTLKELIPERLSNLTAAESSLLDSATTGKLLNLQAGEPDVDNPANADNWGAERTIRAEFLRWICTDKKASELIDARGIRIIGARVDGKLDFEGATVPHPLVLASCSIKDGIILLDARTRTINLHNTHTSHISGDMLTVDGALFLRNGFLATGAVRLLGAKVNGGLDCSGGSFVNDNGDALNADGIEAKGDIFLRKGFSAKGEVRLLGAKVGGNLDCSNGSFVNDNGNALSADGIETKGNIFLNQGFRAKGKVRLIGAKVGGTLNCSGGSFVNENGDALCAQRMTVQDNFFWTLKDHPVGAVDLMHAKVGVLTDNKESWPGPGKLHIDGFEYGALAPDNTPKNAKDRLRWIELQLPPAETIPDAPDVITEPLQKKHAVKWIWIRSRKWLNNTWHNNSKSKPYGNFKNRPRCEFRPQPYEQLAKVLKNMGHESDSREVLIAKQNALSECGDISNPRRLWYRALGISMSHGYKPIRPILFILFMAFIGFIIFFSANEHSFMTRSKLSIFKDNMHLYPDFNPFIYSLDTLIPFVDLHQENYWIPVYNNDHPYWSILIHMYHWFHIIIGWVATSLAAISLSGIVRKRE